MNGGKNIDHCRNKAAGRNKAPCGAKWTDPARYSVYKPIMEEVIIKTGTKSQSLPSPLGSFAGQGVHRRVAPKNGSLCDPNGDNHHDERRS